MDSSKIILDESPEQHWHFLPITGRKVLDLGCGINSEHTPTPIYWLNKGAREVIGVDSSIDSYNWFKINLYVPNFVPHLEMIDHISKFEMYLSHYRPETVKMDIEGSEILLGSLKREYLDSVKDIAIEYHNLACKLTCQNMLKEYGYEVEFYKFDHLDIDFQGVIYGHKPFEPIKLEKKK